MKRHRLNGKKLADLPRGFHTDGFGLELCVQPSGTRSWRQRLVIKGTGERVMVGLGGYPVVLLSEAREKALENVRKARQGMDFRTVRKPVFDAVAASWAAERANKGWTDRTAHANRLREVISPVVGRVEIDRVSSDHCRRIRDRAKSISAKSRSLSETKMILDHAIASGYIDTNPAENILKTVVKPPSKPLMFLPADVLKPLLPGVWLSDAPLHIRAFLVFNAMVPLRHKEVLWARWNEFKANQWTVPATRMKGRKPFTLEIPSKAFRFLKAMDRSGFDWMGDGYVFGKHVGGKHVRMGTNSAWKNKLGLKDMDIHGYRSSFLTWVADTGRDVQLGRTMSRPRR